MRDLNWRSLRRLAGGATVAMACFIAGTAAMAQSADGAGGKVDAGATAIINSLAPIESDSPGYAKKKKKVKVGKKKIIVDYRYAMDFAVFFKYNSYQLTDVARLQLKNLGRALASKKLRPYRYLVAGHTDAKGSRQYNAVLSLRRAESVRTHLVETYGIDPDRLVVLGWGEDRLKSPAKPYSEVNRRVEVALIRPKGGYPAADAGKPADADKSADKGDAKTADADKADKKKGAGMSAEDADTILRTAE